MYACHYHGWKVLRMHCQKQLAWFVATHFINFICHKIFIFASPVRKFIVQTEQEWFNTTKRKSNNLLCFKFTKWIISNMTCFYSFHTVILSCLNINSTTYRWQHQRAYLPKEISNFTMVKLNSLTLATIKDLLCAA